MRSTGLILLARSLERIADHATNRCEEIVSLVEASGMSKNPSMAGG
jgi:phosphate uptake regulator